MKLRFIAGLAILSAGALLSLSNVGIASGSATPQNVVLLYNGPAVPNTHAAPSTPAFTLWCNSTCVPSVSLPVADPSTNKAEGTIYVWTKNFDPAGALAFGEFIWFQLKSGDIYVDSGENGTLGAALDPSARPPTHIGADPGIVVAGGGDGTIVGGTGKYTKWTGTYTDRVFVELSFGVTHPNYYDQLFFSINPN